MRATLEGFDVLTVQRSLEAADTVRERKPALVLLDLLMPEMNGFEVLQELRSFSAVPVMILTARGNSRDVVEGLERGADDYLPKPFNLGELAARVRAVLRRSKQDSPAAQADRRRRSQWPDPHRLRHGLRVRSRRSQPGTRRTPLSSDLHCSPHL